MLKVHRLGFGYGKTPVLRDVSFEVKRRCLCGLFGPNGSGKTTLFKCCLKFLDSREGTIELDGRDVRKLRVREMARRVAYVPQEHKPPFPYLAGEVVLMGRTPHLGGGFGIRDRDKAAAWDAMELLDISSLAGRPYNQLSGGQRQMVLIARSIAQETKLVFLDEPTSALDFNNQMRIWKTLRAITRRGVGVIACSHDPNHVAWFCDHVIVLHDGRVLAQGPPSAVFSQSLLDEIYQGVCTVESVNGFPMVLPRSMGNGRHDVRPVSPVVSRRE